MPIIYRQEWNYLKQVMNNNCKPYLDGLMNVTCFYYCLEEDTGPLNLLQRKGIYSLSISMHSKTIFRYLLLFYLIDIYIIKQRHLILMCSKLTISKNTKYLKKVKTKIVNEVNTIDEMKFAITNSLHDFEKSKEIKGWVKYSDNVITTQLELLPKYRKEELRKKLSHSIIGMNTYSIDFYNSVDNRIFDLVCNSPYIDKFRRIIEIQICDDNESVVIIIESYFRFVNLNGCKNFYRSSPVSPILSEAQSYKHLKFEI